MSRQAPSDDGRGAHAPPRWMTAALVLAVAAACTAGVQPWLFALSGAFRPPDFSQDLAAAELLRQGVLPYSDAFRDAHARVYGAEAGHGYPYLPHPPFAVAFALPLTGLPLAAAAQAWFALSIVLLLALALLLGERWTGTRLGTNVAGPPYSVVLVIAGLLVLWPPVLYHLEKGQFSLLLAVLLLLATRALAGRRWSATGVCIGAAAAIKVFPALMGGLLLMNARRALVPAALTGAVLTAVPLLMMGPGGTQAWLLHSDRNLDYWATWPSITYGIHGVLARALVGGPWAVPFVHVPTASALLYLLMAAGMIAAAVRATRDPVAEPWPAVSTWAVLLVLLNPLAMPHNAVLLAWPLLETAARLRQVGGPRLRVAWAVALVLTALPRQTLSGLVPLPASPTAGVLITALPCWGTLVLFAVSCALTRPAGGVLDDRQRGTSRC